MTDQSVGSDKEQCYDSCRDIYAPLMRDAKQVNSDLVKSFARDYLWRVASKNENDRFTKEQIAQAVENVAEHASEGYPANLRSRVVKEIQSWEGKTWSEFQAAKPELPHMDECRKAQKTLACVMPEVEACLQGCYKRFVKGM